ncbi:MAG: Crp/Fnr family transcriptional regulator [Lysobacteraceae bacterium]
MSIDPRVYENRLLASLSPEALARVAPHLQQIPLPLGLVVHQQHVCFQHVVFPTSGVVSLLSVLDTGATTEIGLVGNEGVAGTAWFMGGGPATSQAVVQIAGEGFRMRGDTLRIECERSIDSLHLFLRYMQSVSVQTNQSAVCNRHHSVEQQLCRWLLMTLDRLASNQVSMTQELIANMLGVRREAVTKSAGILQDAGLIRYSRGLITVIDRAGLHAKSCECYDTVCRETQRLIPMPKPRPQKDDEQLVFA